MSEFACKHCGADADSIFAEVTCEGWVGVAIEQDDKGKVSAEHDGRVEDVEVSFTDCYRCAECHKSASTIGDLVRTKAGADSLDEACGRCGHEAIEHPELGWNPKRTPYFTRGPMPCEHEGCDCHDYYAHTRAVVAA